MIRAAIFALSIAAAAVVSPYLALGNPWLPPSQAQQAIVFFEARGELAPVGVYTDLPNLSQPPFSGLTSATAVLDDPMVALSQLEPP